MILSIVIPQCKETEEKIKPLLTTIDLQHGVNFDDIEVIIVYDGSKENLSNEFLNSFQHIHPKYYKTGKNIGPGLCRQTGFDLAQGQYVTFCDADDIYQNVGTLSLYMQIIKDYKPQVLSTSWLEECRNDDTGEYIYVTHSNEATWMHGKVYNKQFITDNDIRFSNELWYHEDSYFNSNFFSVTESDKCVTSDAITYMWTWDDDTITRKNKGAYSYESMEEFMHSIRLSCRWIKERKRECLSEKVAQVIMYGFYTITSNYDNWEQKYIDGASKELWGLYCEFKEDFDKVTIEKLAEIQKSERNKLTSPYIEKITFYEYLQNLADKYGTDWKNF